MIIKSINQNINGPYSDVVESKLKIFVGTKISIKKMAYYLFLSN